MVWWARRFLPGSRPPRAPRPPCPRRSRRDGTRTGRRPERPAPNPEPKPPSDDPRCRGGVTPGLRSDGRHVRRDGAVPLTGCCAFGHRRRDRRRPAPRSPTPTTSPTTPRTSSTSWSSAGSSRRCSCRCSWTGCEARARRGLGGRPPDHDDRAPSCCRRHAAHDRVRARAIVDLYTIERAARARRATPNASSPTFFLRWFMPQIVFYGVGRRRDRPAERPPAVRRADVRADPEQPDRDRDDERCSSRIGPAATDIDGDQRPPSGTCSAIGTTLGVVAMTVALLPSLRRTRVPVRLAVELAERGRPPDRPAGGVGARCTSPVNQIGLIVIIVLGTGDRRTPRTATRSSCSSSPTRSSPSR